MNINSIQKHYDRLTPPERFKAINAALLRGDESEADALRRSCPRKRWDIPTTRGLVEAFDFLAAWHVMTMLELDGLYWALLAVGDDEIKPPDDLSWLDLLRSVESRALSRHAAWVEVCNEYGADPWQWLEGLPGAPAVKFFINTMQQITARAELPGVVVDPKPYADDLRAVIAEHRKRWE